MRRTNLCRMASLAAAVVIGPTLASAQLSGAVIVTPYVGIYTPTNDVARAGFATVGSSATLAARHQSAAAFGANLSYWLNDRFGIEGGAVYSGSHLKSSGQINEPTGTTLFPPTSEQAHVWLGSAKLMMQLMPTESDFNLRFGFGPAIISRGGSAYASDADGKFTGLTDVGAAMSLCTRIPLMSNVAVRLRAEDYMYESKIAWKANIPSEDLSLKQRTQHDFIFSAGLQLFLNR
jgi:hypothetical protein